MKQGDTASWLEALHFPAYGVATALASLPLADLWAVYRFLDRLMFSVQLGSNP